MVLPRDAAAGPTKKNHVNELHSKHYFEVSITDLKKLQIEQSDRCIVLRLPIYQSIRELYPG
jgi:hypothetical protein